MGQQLDTSWLAPVRNLGRERIAYDYTASLIDARSNKVVDQVKGSIYKQHSFYLDSNSAFINLRDADYALQINRRKKEVYVKSIRQMETRAKRKLPASDHVMFDLNGLLGKNIRSSRVVNGADGARTIHVRFKETELSELIVSVDGNGELRQLTIRLAAEQDGDGVYYRMLQMEGFRDQFGQGLVSSQRFLVAARQGLTLKSPYKEYKLEQIRY